MWSDVLNNHRFLSVLPEFVIKEGRFHSLVGVLFGDNKSLIALKCLMFPQGFFKGCCYWYSPYASLVFGLFQYSFTSTPPSVQYRLL